MSAAKGAERGKEEREKKNKCRGQLMSEHETLKAED